MTVDPPTTRGELAKIEGYWIVGPVVWFRDGFVARSAPREQGGLPGRPWLRFYTRLDGRPGFEWPSAYRTRREALP